MLIKIKWVEKTNSVTVYLLWTVVFVEFLYKKHGYIFYKIILNKSKLNLFKTIQC